MNELDIENPFLRKNPFRAPIKFYTENSYSIHSANCSIPDKYHNPFRPAHELQSCKNGRKEKKVENPFYRKNLIKCAQENYNGDYSLAVAGGVVQKPQFLMIRSKFDKSEMNALRMNSVEKIENKNVSLKSLNTPKNQLNSVKNFNNYPPSKDNYENIPNPYKSLLSQNLINSLKKNPLLESNRVIFSQRNSNESASGTSRTHSLKNLNLATHNDGYPHTMKRKGELYYRNMVHVVL